MRCITTAKTNNLVHCKYPTCRIASLVTYVEDLHNSNNSSFVLISYYYFTSFIQHNFQHNIHSITNRDHVNRVRRISPTETLKNKQHKVFNGTHYIGPQQNRSDKCIHEPGVVSQIVEACARDECNNTNKYL